jgi:hypothetical protein
MGHDNMRVAPRPRAPSLEKPTLPRASERSPTHSLLPKSPGKDSQVITHGHRLEAIENLTRIAGKRERLGLKADEIIPPPLLDAELRLHADRPFDYADLEHDLALQMHRNAVKNGKPAQENSNERFKKILGIGWSGDQYIVAKPGVVLARVRSYYDALRIPRDRQMLPAIAYKMPDGTYGDCLWGDPVPPGAKVRLGVLPGEVFRDMLRRGRLAMGGTADAGSNRTNTRKFWNLTEHEVCVFEHDLAHLTGYMQWPEFIMLRRTLAEKPIDATKPSADKLHYLLDESMAFIPEGRHAALKALLDLPKRRPRNGHNYTYGEMYRHLAWRSQKQRDILGARLRREAEDLVVRTGGACRDGLNLNHDIWAEVTRDNEYQRKNNSAKWLASFQLALLTLGDLTAEKWIEETSRGELKKGDVLHRLFNETGEWTRHLKSKFGLLRDPKSDPWSTRAWQSIKESFSLG